MPFPNKSTQFSSTNQPEKNGRKKKIPEIDVLLAEVLGDTKNGIEAAQAILMALRKKAIGGDVRAAEVLLDRAYGKSKQSVDLTSNGETFRVPNIIVPPERPESEQETS